MGCKGCDKHNYECITIVPIFGGLSEEERAEIASITVERPLKRGEYIYRQGESRGELYVLHTGHVKLYRVSFEGKEQIIRTVGAGEFFGELSLFSHKKQTDSAVALESVTMCVIEWEKLRSLMKRIPTIAFKVMEELTSRLEQLEEATLLSVDQRLARYLIEASKGEKTFQLPLSKGDVASLLGISQETLSRKLSLLQQEKLIKLTGQRGVTILLKEALEEEYL